MESEMKKALLIIDVQKSSIRDKNDVKNIEKIQAEYENVFISQFINKDSPIIKFLEWEGYENEELAFVPKSTARVFQKNTYSSIIPEMKLFNQIDICGCDTDACVYKTAMDLVEYGIRPVILSQYCWSQEPDFHAQGMALIERNIGKNNIL